MSAASVATSAAIRSMFIGQAIAPATAASSRVVRSSPGSILSASSTTAYARPSA
jgi:hypothetical protein